VRSQTAVLAVGFGNDHFVATLEMPIWQEVITLPSSMPEYIFDLSGTLVDWSTDPGDDGTFQSRWLSQNRTAFVYEGL
jgi:hypothetical protein